MGEVRSELKSGSRLGDWGLGSGWGNQSWSSGLGDRVKMRVGRGGWGQKAEPGSGGGPRGVQAPAGAGWSESAG